MVAGGVLCCVVLCCVVLCCVVLCCVVLCCVVLWLCCVVLCKEDEEACQHFLLTLSTCTASFSKASTTGTGNGGA